ncbi:MAG: MoaA/NifB/PqqE/SkfB family radical SAM enzyme [Myxococcota bacterium]|jgi:MoaA/NifB/PqqE/SkfB family radical SAM enzyme
MNAFNDMLLLARAATVNSPGGPFKLTVATTWVCDQKCTHCAIWERPRTDELDAGEWRRVWRNASPRLSWLDLTGGEVTTRADFAEIAIAAIEECPRLALLHYPSNGRRPEVLERITRAILAANPPRLIVSLSLDGPPAVHDELRGDVGSFEKTVESYARLRALGVETYFGMTLSPFNVDHIAATFASLAERIDGFSWRDLHVNFLHVSDHYFGNSGIETTDPAKLKAAIDELIARRGPPRHPTHLLEHLFLRRIDSYMQSGRSPLPCASLAGNAFIDPTGMVFPCHIWDEPIASLRDHDYSLKEIWALEKRSAVRAQVQAEQCPGCWTPCEAYPSILSNLGPANVLA